ncbi:hypothetical protein BDR07DRAFT_1383652 [Suillus spraguei]|nr:hypothetical protein BDR07DRAFT_1383652 [Suillus spraguei]
MYANMWRLWKEEEKKARGGLERRILRSCVRIPAPFWRNTRYLGYSTVLELLSSSYDAVISGQERVTPKDANFLQVDPIRPENRAIFANNGPCFLFPPNDLAKWFDGKVDGLQEAFQKTLKAEALKALKRQDRYFQTQYHQHARLPERWHEGQQPRPYFWSIKHWQWVANGNNLWLRPIDFLFYVLNEKPLYTVFEQFTQDLDALLNIVTEDPDREDVYNIANQLWFGEMTWREFVDTLMSIHLRLKNAVSTTSEIKDPTNVFDTFEARLVLEGYVRRQELNPGRAWDLNDDVLWAALGRVTVKKYKSAWSWVISEVSIGKNVAQVLKEVGPWRKLDKRNAERKQRHLAPIHDADVDPDADTDADTDADADADADADEENEAGGSLEAAVPVAQTSDRAYQSMDEENMEIDHEDDPQDSGQQPALNSNAGRVLKDAQGSAVQETWRIINEPVLTPEQSIAVQQFSEYRNGFSLVNYAATLKAHYSAEHTASINDYIAAIEALGPSPGNNLEVLFHRFIHRVIAIEARKAAERRQEDLL